MKCPECGAKLDSTETFWDCPECGYFKVTSKYTRLEAANERFLKKLFSNDDMPEGCASCGNPAYPDCQSSCPIFDD